ncbi:MAG: endolytic transglycosylase MltG [Candidatus Kapabacteria bacterium]|nr:endolytic transglycosylase MltG [Candidatus Kapabacteria bacterium]
MKRSLLRIILVSILLTSALVGVTAWFMLRPLPLDADHAVHIARRTSISRAIDSVHAQCSLPTPMMVKIVTRVLARVMQKPIQHGWYVFTSRDTQWDVILALLSGRRRPAIKVTIPEGLTYREIASILSRKAEIDSAGFIMWCESDSVIRTHTLDAPSMEGYLMPDTYEIFLRDEPSAVGERLCEESRRRWNSLSTLRPRREVLTLASIVQAEAAAVKEMPRIAGVYVNRLRKNMRLEADPTVQYGLGMKRRVLYRDLDNANDYNTYTHVGLPPGPICNPGLDAIRAALFPEEHIYLFFVARGDSSGLHRFAQNGSEHVENVRRYRKARR